MRQKFLVSKLFVGLSLITVMMLTQVCSVVEAAATLELSDSQRAALTQASSTDPSRASRINALYSEIIQLQAQIKQDDEALNASHYRNEESLTTVRKQVQQINAAQLLKLNEAVKQTQARYKPLFTMYTSLSNQLTVARKLKNKQLTSVLSTQLEAAKITVQLAREDIRAKQSAHSAVREATTLLQKKIRNELSSITNLKVKIKAEKTNVTALNKQLSPEWRNLTQSIKNKDATAANRSLSNVSATLRQITSGKQKMITIERQIETVILSAKSKLPQ